MPRLHSPARDRLLMFWMTVSAGVCCSPAAVTTAPPAAVVLTWNPNCPELLRTV